MRVERTHADTYMDTIDAQAAPAPAAPAATEAMLDDEVSVSGVAAVHMMC